MWSISDGHGGTKTYYYYDAITWIVAALAVVWFAWFMFVRYRRASALRRPPRQTDYRQLKRTVKIKRELSAQYLAPGFSGNIHAVGIGMLGQVDDYCIQIFIDDSNAELWPGSAAAALPNSYRGIPLVLFEMGRAAFLSGFDLDIPAPQTQYPNGIRDTQEVIVGGISGANANLSGQSGTIGYFCRRRSRLRRQPEVHLLSNSHVFADLRKTEVDDGDLIMQPSPGEPAGNRPIAALVKFSRLKFDGDLKDPNHVDAAVARLWESHQYKTLIPLIGAVKGYVPTQDIQVGEAARKFGRTTGYTEGRVFSIYLDIWIRYDRTRQSAFFQDQLLIEPLPPASPKFVAKGDSGSLVVDAEQHAIGLIFAGVAEPPESIRDQSAVKEKTDPARDKPKRVEGYGVANPISEVSDRLKIDLVFD